MLRCNGTSPMSRVAANTCRVSKSTRPRTGRRNPVRSSCFIVAKLPGFDM
jgi:hypothetical protein